MSKLLIVLCAVLFSLAASRSLNDLERVKPIWQKRLDNIFKVESSRLLDIKVRINKTKVGASNNWVCSEFWRIDEKLELCIDLIDNIHKDMSTNFTTFKNRTQDCFANVDSPDSFDIAINCARNIGYDALNLFAEVINELVRTIINPVKRLELYQINSNLNGGERI